MEKQALDHQIKAFCYTLAKQGYLDAELTTKRTDLEHQLRGDIHRMLLSPRIDYSNCRDEDKWDTVAAITEKWFPEHKVQFRFNLELHFLYHTLKPFGVHVSIADQKPFTFHFLIGHPYLGFLKAMGKR